MGGTLTFVCNGRRITTNTAQESSPSFYGVVLARELRHLLRDVGLPWMQGRCAALKVHTPVDNPPSIVEISTLHTYGNEWVGALDCWHNLLFDSYGSIRRIFDCGHCLEYKGTEEYNYVVDFDACRFSIIRTPFSESYDFGDLAKCIAAWDSVNGTTLLLGGEDAWSV
jgi:hypothetical protein